MNNLCVKYDQCVYGKCFINMNSFLFLFSNKMLVFRAGIGKLLVAGTGP